MSNTNYVEILRHSVKETEPSKSYMLSHEGQEMALRLGYSKAEEYRGLDVIVRGSDFQATDAYMGRAAESAMLIAMGARWKLDLGSIVDNDLAVHWSSQSTAMYKKMTSEGMNELDICLKVKEDSYADALMVAKFIDHYAHTHEGATIGVSHNTHILVLAYLLLKGDKETAGIPVKELTGLKVSYDKDSDTYTVSMDYAGGKTVKIRNTSMADYVKAIMERDLAKDKAREKGTNLEEMASADGKESEDEDGGGDACEAGDLCAQSENAGENGAGESGSSGESE